MRASYRIETPSSVVARRLARTEAYKDGYHGLRVLEVTSDASPNRNYGWRVAIEATGRRADPWTEGDDPSSYGYQTRIGVRVRTLVPAQGQIRGQTVSMPAGLVGTVKGYVGFYRRVLLDERPEGTFIFRPPELAPLERA
jgi:hypothetical protein